MSDFTAEDILKLKSTDLLELAKENDIEIPRKVKNSVNKLRGFLIQELIENRGEEEIEVDVHNEDGLDDGENGLSFEQRLELQKLELEREKIRDREKEREFQREKWQFDIQLQENGSNNGSEGDRFRVNDCYRSVPYFDENDIEQFFSQFEYVANSLNWPRQFWCLIFQSKLKGKAAKAYCSLSVEDKSNYEKVKDSIKLAYQLTSEAYRQRFRELKKEAAESYCDFVSRSAKAFDLWHVSESVGGDFEKLRELIILEDFKNKLPSNVRMHLEDQGTTQVRSAAELSDKFALIHKPMVNNARSHDQFKGNRNGKPSYTQGYASSQGSEKSKDEGVTKDQGVAKKSELSAESKSFIPKCHYCSKRGHLIANCFARKRDQEKMVGFVKLDQKFSNVISPGVTYHKYISQARISTSKGSQSKPVSVFRDTGAFCSLIRRAAIAQPEVTATGQSVVIQVVGGAYQTVPLHRVYLESDYVNGEVLMGMVDHLPLSGVDILLGSDLTDRCCPSKHLIISPVPVEKNASEDVETFPACAVTRSMGKKARCSESVVDSGTASLERLFTESRPRAVETGSNLSEHPKEVESVGKQLVGSDLQVSWDRKELVRQQKEDDSLRVLWEKVEQTESVDRLDEASFDVEDGMLIRKSRVQIGEDYYEDRVQVVVPLVYREELMSLAHGTFFSGHLGRTKTYDKIVGDFYWPGVYADTEQYCKTCHTCQVVGKPNQTIPPSKLHSIPVKEAFTRVQIDIVGPLPRTKQGNLYMLTVMCLTTRFPEAIPLRKVTAAVVAKALIKYFTMTGLPTEIQSDRGTNFTSKLFRQVSELLGIKQVFSSAYHPQSQGAIERFHQSLKNLLRCYVYENEKDWDTGLPYVLFAVRDAKQESLGFSPFELLYGHKPRGPLQLVKANWIASNSEEGMLGYVARIKERLFRSTELAKKHLYQAQAKSKLLHDSKSQDRQFTQGDKVLLYLPIEKSALHARYFGPYEVVRKLSDVGYVISTPDRCRKTRFCHVNLLKAYHERPEVVHVAPVACVAAADTEPLEDAVTARLNNSEVLANLDEKLRHRTPSQQQQLGDLIRKFSWTSDCEDAFQQAKTMLCSSPVLAAPNFERPFKVAVDASGIGSGAVLFQEGDDCFDHPVGYYSKKFNRHELNYSTVEKEGVGLIQALGPSAGIHGSQPFDIYPSCEIDKSASAALELIASRFQSDNQTYSWIAECDCRCTI